MSQLPSTLPHPATSAGTFGRYARSNGAGRRLLRIVLVLGLAALPLISAIVVADAATAVVSVADGPWSSGATWSTGQPPAAGDMVTVSTGHAVTVDVASARVSGVMVEADSHLVFDAGRSVTLESSGNVVVHGRLAMTPSSAARVHTLRFVDVDESAFVGGGMDVLASDVGLWVRHHGKLDLQGAEKTAWTRLAGSVSAGATQLTLEAAPTGWRAGDRLVVTPTEHPSAGKSSYNGFDEALIASVSGTTVTLDRPLANPHPEVEGRWTAEVLNLTRNVRVEGTGDGSKEPGNNGRAHINIHSHMLQTVRYVQLSHLGPRLDTGKSTSDGMKTEGVLGRYPLHFHHNGDESRGTVVEGVVVAHGGHHAFVPHASHGITIRDSIAYDTWDDAYWWDPPPWDDPKDPVNDTHGNVWERNVAAVVKTDPSFRGYRLTGFNLGRGDNDTNVIRDSVAVGVLGNSDANGFNWPERAGAVWIFEDNVAHNNKVDGAFVWQNSHNFHIVDRFDAYHNGGYGIDHGAYRNHYQYRNLTLLGNGEGAIAQKALVNAAPREDGYGLAFEHVVSDGKLALAHHNLPSDIPTLYRNCSFSHVVVNETAEPGLHDFVNCGLEPSDFQLESQPSGSRIRVQRADGTAFQIDDQGRVTTINPFYDNPPQDQDDTTPPSITLDSPTDGASLSGTVTLSATATDDSGVDRVEFLVDGDVVATDDSGPYSASWDSTSVGDGSHTVQATAYDTSANEASSAIVTVTVDNAEPPPPPSSDPILLYGFEEGSGTTVHDLSGDGTPLDLEIADPSAVTWLDGALSVDASTMIASGVAATEVSDAVKASNQLSIEAWLSTDDLTQDGPARIATVSGSSTQRNATLGQATDTFDVRLRTTSTDDNGRPSVSTASGTAGTDLTHVVYTRAPDGSARIYLDGVEATAGVVDGDLSNWDGSYPLVLANEVDGGRPWLGELHQIAVFAVSLDAAQVASRFQEGPTAGRSGSRVVPDFDGDGVVDVGVFRPSNGNWFIRGQGGFSFGGQVGDVPVPADWVGGDGVTDAAIFRPSNGRWYIRGGDVFGYGAEGDVPVPADWDGDGVVDAAVYRPSNGNWFIRGQGGFSFGGQVGDVPVPADWDGDGVVDAAIFRPSNGRWYIRGGDVFGYGAEGDVPVPADWDGDGVVDAAVYRPSNGAWFVRGQGGFSFGGQVGDVPVPADYDDDGILDAAIFRPSNGRWYIRGGDVFGYGQAGDIPLVAPQHVLTELAATD